MVPLEFLYVVAVVFPVQVRVGQVAVRVHAAADELVEIRNEVRVVREGRTRLPQEEERHEHAPVASEVGGATRGGEDQERDRRQHVPDAELRLYAKAEEQQDDREGDHEQRAQSRGPR
jgi:hypothetical protein